MRNNDKQHALVPRLRFPEFEDEAPWMQKPLGNFGRFIRGLTYSAPDVADEGLLVVRSSNIQNGNLVLDSDLVFVDKDCPPDLILRMGDIAICMSNGSRPLVGKNAEFTGSFDDPFTVGAFCSIFRPSSEFAKYLLRTPRYEQLVVATMGGGNINNLKNSDLETLGFSVPLNSAEQQKIANCLGSLDDLIAAEGRKLAALRDHKKGLMQQLFPREGETRPRLRFPEFRNAPAWTDNNLGRIFKFVRGPFGGALKKEIFVSKGYAVYEQSHAIHGHLETFRYFINEKRYRELRRFSVNSNDIIMSCSGTMGRFQLLPLHPVPGVINQALLKLTVVEDHDPRFMLLAFQLPSNLGKLLTQSAGGAMKNVVGVKDLKAVEFKIPKPSEQQRIADCLSALDARITAQTEKLDALRTHKRGLMQQLFPSPEDAGA